jgi:glycine/D-amino acid oxidase-like deaminating enzyme
VLDRDQIGSGTTSQSSGILRTHYSVQENVALARASWKVFNDFSNYLGDGEASCGLVKCGYLICAPDGDKLSPLRSALDQQSLKGIPLSILDANQAAELLPIADFRDAALIGYEPEAGFADAYMTASSFARAARLLGVSIREGVVVNSLLREGDCVVGVSTSAGDFIAGTVISTQNIWTHEVAAWMARAMYVQPERHVVLALEGPRPYTFNMPVLKDLGSRGMLYCRSYGGKQMLVSEGVVGETLSAGSNDQGDVSLDYVAEVGEQVATRFPSFDTAGLASAWTGVYDVTPDWNPVLGRIPGVQGLVVGYGFSGHGFKLSPAVGRVLAECALGVSTSIALEPYSIERFSSGRMLVGKYGMGAVS